MSRTAVVFSGGTAFRETSCVLARMPWSTEYLLPGTDSGGSSAMLRRFFHMPAVGDLRSRLIALSRPSSKTKMMDYRLPKDRDAARHVFDVLTHDDATTFAHPAPLPFRRQVSRILALLQPCVADGLDLTRASVGNLVLAALYLQGGRSMAYASQAFGRLIGARGTAWLSSEADVQLCARLANGRIIMGQHRLTGKECPPLESGIGDLWLSDARADGVALAAAAPPYVLEAIGRADLVVFTVGSFYSSIVAQLLFSGISAALRGNPCPKVFIPNAQTDPELVSCSLTRQAEILRDRGGLTHVVVDSRSAYPGGICPQELRERGIDLVRARLNRPNGHVEPHAAADVMKSFLFS